MTRLEQKRQRELAERYPKDTVVRCRRTRRLLLVLAPAWRSSSSLKVVILPGKEQTTIHWSQIEEVHPLEALAACA